MVVEALDPTQALNEVESSLKGLRQEIIDLHNNPNKNLTADIRLKLDALNRRFARAHEVASNFEEGTAVRNRFVVEEDLGDMLADVEQEFIIPPEEVVPKSSDPEFFTGELTSEIQAVKTGILDKAIADLTNPANPDRLDPTIDSKNAAINTWLVAWQHLLRSAQGRLVAARDKASARITKIEGNPTDINGNDTADRLRRTYLQDKNTGLETLLKQIENLQTQILDLWVRDIETIHPEFAELNRRVADIGADINNGDPNVLSTELDTLERNARLAVGPELAANPKFGERLNTYWNRTEAVRQKLRDRSNKEASDKAKIDQTLMWLDGELASLKNQLFSVTASNNVLEKRYEPLKERLDELPETQAVLEAKMRVLTEELRSLIIFGDWQIEDIENSSYDIGGTKSTLGTMENFMYNRAHEIVGFVDPKTGLEKTEGELKLLGEKLSLLTGGDYRDYEIYRKELEAFWNDVYARFKMHVTWMSVHDSVLGKGERKPPEQQNPDTFMLTGDDADYLIKQGIMNSGLGGHASNAVMQTDVVRDVRSLTVPGAHERSAAYDETAMGYCMRMFDRVYQGLEPDAKANDGTLITTRNLHNSYLELINWVTKHEAERAAAVGERPKFDRNLVQRAFRLHTMITMNQSYLAENSPTLTDNLYYMFNWVDYCIKYAYDGTNNFAPMVTYMLFSYQGVDPFKQLYGEKKLKAINQAMEDKLFLEYDEDLFHEQGYGSFGFLFKGPLMYLDNVAQGSELLLDEDGNFVDEDGHRLPAGVPPIYREKVKTPVFDPPLRWFAQTTIDAEGNKVPVRYPALPGQRGAIVTLDDMQDSAGNRLYEHMNLKGMGTEIMEYYNQLGKNGMAFLGDFLKAPKDEFLKNMENIPKVAALKNQGKYSMALFPGWGIEIARAENESYRGQLSKALMNMTIARLILAKCLMETDLQNEKFWSIEQIENYLRNMANAKVIDHKTADAIKIVVIEGSRVAILARSTVDGIVQQFEKAAEFH